MQPIAIYCADIGSMKNGAFGWSGLVIGDGDTLSSNGSSISDLADEVAFWLNSGIKVALGFECPLFVPINSDPYHLSSARVGEGSKAWSSQVGACVMATGLTQTVWLLARIKDKLNSEPIAYHEWSKYIEVDSGLFLWEAFVTGAFKSQTHCGDAEIAVNTFISALPDPTLQNAILCQDVHSLIGAALLRTGWSQDLLYLSTPCLVLKA